MAAVHAGRVGNVSDHRARGTVNDQDMCAARQVDAAGFWIGGEIVSASRSTDVEPFGLEPLGFCNGSMKSQGRYNQRQGTSNAATDHLEPGVQGDSNLP